MLNLVKIPKQIQYDSDLKVVDALGEELQVGHRALAAITMAREYRDSAADPRTSNFSVGAALVLENGAIVGGANYEYGGGLDCSETRAIHAEESAMARAKQEFGPEIGVEVVAVAANTEGPVSCCGNCLDVIRTNAVEDAVILGSGRIGFSRLYELVDVFPEQFHKTIAQELPTIHQELVKRAREAVSRGFSVFSAKNLGPSGAAVLSINGTIYEGTREDNAAYHPISALDAAIAHSRIHGDSVLTAVAIVSKQMSIHGRDRQRIYERADENDLLDQMIVYILQPDGEEVTIATPRELLPFGFGARSLGLLNEVRQQVAVSNIPLRGLPTLK